MYPAWVVLVGGVAILLWLGGLTYLYLKERNFLNKLFSLSGKEDVRDRFQEVLKVLAEEKRRELILNHNIRQIALAGLGYIQKVAVLRYNPYDDVGGDQSFSIAILDGRGTGFILTSLHTRAVTRVYTKVIREGKSNLKLSKEEEKVIEQALDQEEKNESD